MNDETNPAPSEPIVPPIFEPDFPPHTSLKSSSPPPPPKPLSYWLKKLLVCNPFYLTSAALLLYGVYRIALDPNFFATETGQLTFNFSALQSYELLLAATATLLFTRRIWYDASLLVVLENLLWIVPFILISQAAFIEPQTATCLCLLAVALVAGRMTWFRKHAGDIVPSTRMLLCGGPILLANAAWPIIYRHFQETKVGINITSGAAYEFNELNWFWLLPAVATLMLWLPRPETNIPTSRMRRWFPLMLFSFWLLGTGVHLYALGYVYDFKLRREQLAPLLWVLAWAWPLRLPDFFAMKSQGLSGPTLFLPLLATLPAAFVADSHVFFILSTLNLFAFGIRLLLQPDNRLALQLGLFSFAAMVAALPIDFTSIIARPVTQSNLIGLAALAYVIVGAVLSRSPKIALLGALAAMIIGGVARQAHADWLYWAMQAGFGYFLLHSLRWQDERHDGAAGVRIFVAACWVFHSFIWVRNGASLTQSLALASGVLLIWTIRGLIWKNWRQLTLPIAAGLVTLCLPTNLVITKTQSAPAGVLYVVGSFALFGIGTLAALTKHRWHKHSQP